MQIYLRLPGRAPEHHEDFMALSRVFPQAAMEKSPSGPQLNASAPNNLPITALPFEVIVLSDNFALTLEQAQFAVRTPHASPNIYDSILKDAPARRTDAIPIEKAADLLEGHAKRIDHIGINIPRALSPAIWKNATQLLSRDKKLYEYPNGVDGYDKRKNLWLFLVQKGKTAKFELAHDGVQEHSVVQFDIKTDLSPALARKLFPQGFQLEGLDDFFWSVPVSTRIPGMQEIRLDIRYAHDKSAVDVERTEWENGQFFLRGGKALSADKPARLPAFKL